MGDSIAFVGQLGCRFVTPCRPRGW